MSTREPSQWVASRLRSWLWIYAGMVAVVGVVSGIIWNRLVVLPSYVIGDDFQARLPESGLRQIVVADVCFAMIGVVAGLLLGVAAWLLFRQLSWWSTVLACAGAIGAGLVAWVVAEFIGSRNFAERIATATRGDSVRVDFSVHTWTPLAVWVGVAVVPIVVGSLSTRRAWGLHAPGPLESVHDPDQEALSLLDDNGGPSRVG